MKNENEERDDFWNIENMLPKRSVERSVNVDTEPVTIELGETDGQDGEKIKRTERNEKARKIIESFEKKNHELLSEYKPDNPYIVSVKIYEWPTKYTFYERFAQLGKKYLNVTVNKCEYVPFFSYTPQYNQMTVKQLRYYIWWRTNFKKGIYLVADINYICLYIYELINVDGDETDEVKLEHMAKLWLAYRKEFPRLDSLIGEWLCDFCLIHQLPPPPEISEISGEISHIVSLREFYSANSTHGGEQELRSFIIKNNRYDFTRSLLYSDKTKSMFEKHLISAAVFAVDATDAAGMGKISSGTVKMSRDAYSGALCICEKKRRIDIEYYSISHPYRSGPLITLLVKYSENKLREYLGAKSRLNTNGLPQNMKNAVDEYYDRNLPKKQSVTDESEQLEKKRYEMYEVLDNTLDINKAVSLENNSWQTAAILTADETKNNDENDSVKVNLRQESENKSGNNVEVECENEYEQLYAAFSKFQKRFFDLIYDGKINDAESLCKSNGMLPQSVADEINALAFEITSDIIIEQMQIIGDYRDEFKRD